MKKAYTEPNMMIDFFEEAITTEGINVIGGGSSDSYITDGLVDEEEEY